MDDFSWREGGREWRLEEEEKEGEGTDGVDGKWLKSGSHQWKWIGMKKYEK